MARPPSPKAGIGPCPSCGASIIFRMSAGGMLTHSCGYCDSSGFAQKDGDAYKKRIESFTVSHLEPKDTPPARTNPKETPKTNPEDEKLPKRASSVFDLGNL